ncbi:MAG: hypothetical protein KJ955_00265 [Nanoarchaeota archaeon]|nr:hypothetical protein [Nanoarchaeota archaeon]
MKTPKAKLEELEHMLVNSINHELSTFYNPCFHNEPGYDYDLDEDIPMEVIREVIKRYLDVGWQAGYHKKWGINRHGGKIDVIIFRKRGVSEAGETESLGEECRGCNLTKQEKEKLGLDKKVQIVWDDEIQGFKAEGKAVDVIPLGTPMLARIYCVSCDYGGDTSYKATRNAVPFDRINEAFNAYLKENPYKTSMEGVRAKLDAARLDANASLLEKAKYFSVGNRYSTKMSSLGLGIDEKPQKTIIVPVALYRDKEKTKKGGK